MPALDEKCHGYRRVFYKNTNESIRAHSPSLPAQWGPAQCGTLLSRYINSTNFDVLGDSESIVRHRFIKNNILFFSDLFTFSEDDNGILRTRRRRCFDVRIEEMCTKMRRLATPCQLEDIEEENIRHSSALMVYSSTLILNTLPSLWIDHDSMYYRLYIPKEGP